MYDPAPPPPADFAKPLPHPARTACGTRAPPPFAPERGAAVAPRRPRNPEQGGGRGGAGEGADLARDPAGWPGPGRARPLKEGREMAAAQRRVAGVCVHTRGARS